MLEKIIQNLIEQQEEGDYWDFKLKYQSTPRDLIHDIICLANTVHHKGDRYLIIGIDPVTFQAKKIEGTIYTQADIVGLLNDVYFANGRRPHITKRVIIIDKNNVEVIVIKDLPEKPYYLEQAYSKNGGLNAGTIYSRVRDRNTPINGVAPASDIERMWRERFNIDKTPLDRIGVYLQDFDEWETAEEGLWHHKIFPEFTIHFAEDSTVVPQYSDCWCRICINERASYNTVILSYHQTKLWSGTSVLIDGAKLRVACPHTRIVGSRSTRGKYFYSYIKESMEYKLHGFLISMYGGKSRSYTLEDCMEAIVLFTDENEEDEFQDFLNDNMDLIEQETTSDNFDHKEPESVREDLIFANKVKSLHSKWLATERGVREER